MENEPKKTCQACQYENRPENNFCTRCGISLNAKDDEGPCLVFADGLHEERFPLSRHENKIGRDLSNEIVIHDAQISKQHAVVIREGERFLVDDYGSKNGVFVDGEKIQKPVIIEDGSLIKLGSTLLRFQRE
ncbi:MAG: FHA domain-containing protein [Deferribacteres bacterium]|nr:FHA domain-containing protein [candidate division KSB1 bacterium]MCB9503294.1 FHA domain-containing protein [Deferribacteres bacterium]